MSLRMRVTTAGVNATRTLIWALAICWGAVHFTGLAKAQEPPPQSRVWVRLNSDLLESLIKRPIEEVQFVDEVILGVRSIGYARVEGRPEVMLADDAHDAAFCVTVTGTIHSRTTGHKGPVQIDSRSTTRFTATKRIAFQPGRGFIGEAAQIAVQSTSRPERIVARRDGILGRAIERRAWARVAESREQVTRIVQAKAEAKIREAFDRLLKERLARLNRLAQQRYLVAAVFGAPRYDCWTSDGWLNIAVSSADDSSSTRTPALETAPGRYGTVMQVGPPIQVWVHERVLGESLTVILRRVDLARQLVGRLVAATQPRVDSAVALVWNRSSTPSYNFATIGDSFVFHAGEWNRAQLAAVATANSANPNNSNTSPSRAAGTISAAGE